MIEGVDPFGRGGGVGGPAAQLDLDDGVAAEGLGEGEPGGLGDEDGLGGEVEVGEGGDERGGADARVLLVGDEGEDDLHGEVCGLGALGGDDDRGDAPEHVAGAATREARAVVADPRLEGAIHALDPHRVEVPGERDRGVRVGGSRPGEQAGAARLGGLDDVGGEACGVEPGAEVLDDLALAGRTGDETGVDRVDGDEGAGQIGDVVHAGSVSATPTVAT